MTTIPQQIKEKRKQIGETQAVFGRRFGKSHAAVSEWESGKAEAEFVTELLLNPRRLFAWWKEQQQVNEITNDELDAQVASVQRLLDEATRKHHRTLDGLTDNLDDDEERSISPKRNRSSS